MRYWLWVKSSTLLNLIWKKERLAARRPVARHPAVRQQLVVKEAGVKPEEQYR